jgi:hypothetical protein
MGRKGDITSKVIGVRAPIKIYTKLLNEASDKGISLSEYCVSLLSKDNFNQGGQTKIEYRDKIVEVPKIEYRDRIIEKPINTLVEYKDKIVYKDRIVEKIVEKKIEVDNPKLLLKIQELEKYNYELTMLICLPNQNKKP